MYALGLFCSLSLSPALSPLLLHPVHQVYDYSGRLSGLQLEPDAKGLSPDRTEALLCKQGLKKVFQNGERQNKKLQGLCLEREGTGL